MLAFFFFLFLHFILKELCLDERGHNEGKFWENSFSFPPNMFGFPSYIGFSYFNVYLILMENDENLFSLGESGGGSLGVGKQNN